MGLEVRSSLPKESFPSQTSTNNNLKKDQRWLTAGTTVSNLWCATCTTLTTTGSWTRTISSASQSETPSLKPRENGARMSTRRTRKSWPTSGMKSLTLLTSTRMVRYLWKSSKRVLKCLAKERITQISHKLSNFSSIVHSEQLM